MGWPGRTRTRVSALQGSLLRGAWALLISLRFGWLTRSPALFSHLRSSALPSISSPAPPPSASPSATAPAEPKAAAHDYHPPAHDRPLFPSVHRLLAENNITDLSKITGTGKRGMITKGDILTFLGLASGPLGTFTPPASPIPQKIPAAGKEAPQKVRYIT